MPRIIGPSSTINLTSPPTSIGTTTPVAVNSTIFTALPVNNTSAYVASNSLLTGSNAQSLVNLSQTWNTTGTPTAIFANITDTASNNQSRLIDLQINGASRFVVYKSGITTVYNDLALMRHIGFGSSVDNLSVYLQNTSNTGLRMSLNQNTIGGSFAAGSFFIGATDTVLTRGAANTISQQNGINSQTYWLYKSFTDASNYTRAAWGFNSQGIILAGESAGTGNADIGFSFGIKGTGAFQLRQTDNTATGGNVRGINAVDLQIRRNGATQVASGNYSFVAGEYNTSSGEGSAVFGNSNTASGTSSAVFGDSNNASGDYSFATGNSNTALADGSAVFGNSNTASGVYSFAAGSSNNASGDYSFAAGYSNNASGHYSAIFGNYGSTKNVSNLFVLGTDLNSSVGKAQTGILGLAAITTDATATRLKSDIYAASAYNQLALQNNSAVVVQGLAIATITGAGDTKSWYIVVTIKRGANAASTTLVGTPTITVLHGNAGTALWTLELTADTVNGCLAANVTTGAGVTVCVNLSLFASEVAF